MDRAERRRRQKAATAVKVPEFLDARKAGWDRRLLDVIDHIEVDGAHIGLCDAYSVQGSWAIQHGAREKMYGKVVVVRKELE